MQTSKLKITEMMYQNFKQNKAFIFSKAMETGDRFKNGASPKSRMSR
jgi:hypothetical protein